MTQRSLKVAVTGFDGLDVPHPGIGVTRALREGWDGPIEIHGLCYDPLTTGAWAGAAVDQIHLLPPLSDGDGAVLDRLVGLASRHRFDAVIPTLDLEVPVMSRLADRLLSVGIRSMLPSQDAVFACNKLQLARFCHEHGFPGARTIHVLDLDRLPLHADQFGYPLIIKGVVAGAKRVFDTAQAVREGATLNERWGGGVLLQDILNGEEYNVAAIVGEDGAPNPMVTIRKVGINTKGKGIFCTVIDDAEIEDHARSIIAKLDWRGPVELEFIKPQGSKLPRLVEVNPRFPAWIMLSHWAGCNLPVALLEAIMGTGKRRRYAKPKAGTSFVRDIAETAVAARDIEKLSRFKSVSAKPARRDNAVYDDRGLRVAVSGISTFDVVNAGLGVARALRLDGRVARIVGMGYGAYDSGLYRPELFDAVYRLPAVDQTEPLLRRLREIQAEDPVDVIVPCLDGELPRFIEIGSALREIGIRTLLPDQAAFDRRGKRSLFTELDLQGLKGFAVPATRYVTSEADAAKAMAKLGTPVVLKGTISHAIPVACEGDLGAAWAELRGHGYTEALVQQHVEGERFAVAAVCDRQHETVASLTVKKLRICDRGSTWSAVHLPHPELEAAVAALLKKIEWTGPAEAEFIRDEMTERFHLIEVNPRFTAWIAYSAQLGLNHPMAAVRAAMDLPSEPMKAAKNLVFMRACDDAPLSNTAFAAIATKGALRYA